VVIGEWWLRLRRLKYVRRAPHVLISKFRPIILAFYFFGSSKKFVGQFNKKARSGRFEGLMALQ
jgi:hypothetical protein